MSTQKMPVKYNLEGEYIRECRWEGIILPKFRIKDIMSELRQANVKATQAGMAEAAGVPQSYISRIVNNQTKAIDPNILIAIANYLTKVSNRKFTIAHLFDEVDTEQVEPFTETQRGKIVADQIKRLDRVDNLLADMGDQFGIIRQEIADIRTEISKLNEHGGVN